MVMVNVGCGAVHHPAWVNLDLVSTDADVRAWDVCRGLPFADSTVDAVYSSHVLEHLAAEEATRLLAEAYRVLRPCGVIRVVVPDLAAICDAYLKALSRRDHGSASAKHDHDWLRLELYDQMVREQSGGQMGPYVRQPDLPNRDFVRERVGLVFDHMRQEPSTRRTPVLRWSLVRRGAQLLQQRVAEVIVTVIGGAAFRSALRVGLFRQSGEIHRQMYDRHALRDVLERAGFTQVEVCSATHSRIPGYEDFGLDSVGGQVRKADSMFVEAIRPVAYGAGTVAEGGVKC